MANDSISVSVKGGEFPLPPLHRTKNNYHSPPMGYFRIAYKTSRLSPKILGELRFKISLGIRKIIKNNANTKFWGTNKVYQDGRVENTEWWVVISMSNWAKNTRVCYDLKRLCNLPVGKIFICTYKAERWTAFRCVLRPRRQKLDNPSPRHSSGPCFIYYVVQGRA